MNYRTIPAGRLLDICIRARGFEPSSYLPTLTDKEREWFADLVNEAWETVHRAEMWPHSILVERRTYRPVWNAQENYAAGHEVYYDGTYYRSLVRENMGNTPGADEINWDGAPEGFVYTIDYDQFWESNEIDVAGVDFSRCVYDSDPLTKPDAAPIPGCTPWQLSILVPPQIAPVYPYVRFKRRCPEISFLAWNASTLYARGETCYLASTQQSYVALRSNQARSPDEETDDWWPVGFPADWVRYARYYVQAMMQSESDGKYATQAAAERELDRLRYMLVQQTGLPVRARYRSVR